VLLVTAAEQSELSTALAERGFGVTWLPDVERALPKLEEQLVDAVLFEVATNRPGPSLDGLGRISEHFPDLPLVACGAPEAELSRRALAAGASEFLSLPLGSGALELALAPALARRRSITPESAHVDQKLGLLGDSARMTGVRERIRRVAGGTATVLVRGETGTGKELAARALHAESPRRDKPFIRVHASALPDALLESELFGYEKGAFTGATARKQGRVELAEGGTLFFDEIGELSPTMQVKLLRLIQEREYERLGGTQTLRADVRFVAATHRDVEHMVEVGTFREDLFYRLNVVTVWLPPLRSRRDDIALIAEHYLALFRAANGKPCLSFEDAALRALVAQRWPGNVRQLVNFVERLVVLAQGTSIGADDVRRHTEEQMAFLTQAAAPQDGLAKGEQALPQSAELEAEIHGDGAARATSGPEPDVARGAPADEAHFSSAVRPLREDVRRAERRALLKALQYSNGNRALAARMLGVSRRTLYTKLDEHGID